MFYTFNHCSSTCSIRKEKNEPSDPFYRKSVRKSTLGSRATRSLETRPSRFCRVGSGTLLPCITHPRFGTTSIWGGRSNSIVILIRGTPSETKYSRRRQTHPCGASIRSPSSHLTEETEKGDSRHPSHERRPVSRNNRSSLQRPPSPYPYPYPYPFPPPGFSLCSCIVHVLGRSRAHPGWSARVVESERGDHDQGWAPGEPP